MNNILMKYTITLQHKYIAGNYKTAKKWGGGKLYTSSITPKYSAHK